MLDGSSPTATPADFDEAFGQAADVGRLLGSGGHPDQATAALADPIPLGYWPDDEVNAQLAVIEDERTVAAADRINRREAELAGSRIIASFPAGTNWTCTREVQIQNFPDGRVEERTECRVHVMTPGEFKTIANGSGPTWEVAAHKAMESIAQKLKEAEATIAAIRQMDPKGGQHAKAPVTTAA